MIRDKCPHEHIQYCPLYVAAHDPKLLRWTCIDAGAADGHCAVGRGKADYELRYAAIAQADADMVGMCELGEAARYAKEQRANNMRLNGIH